ncbi:signal peptidase I [Sansalvadorimonas sp. 2012CJ34-2]|uniref:Signal peptidase I n=1 Tax=Parendozoicomonas callyspongiae TaxID=2942213 RepID=A0ABT0PFU6_9GAMM|nr:signal peptidase I [Sansalvadorimonas sp. 2012CJ34-2]MCL6270190.1 signal peptidase I [Sansalvadorimonas sp. 2012CJ34-2]
MDLNFPLILVVAVFATGLIALLDRAVLAPRRKLAVARYSETVGQPEQATVDGLSREPAVVETSKSIFPVLLIVLVLRSFLFEPFQIPSGSMLPTLEIGDFILVNKYTYGLRLPVVGTKVVSINDPQPGDVMVFKEPSNPNINFIKRVIGVPGDTIRYVNKTLYVNGKKIPESFVGERLDDFDPRVGMRPVYRIYDETINGVTHEIRKDMMIPNRRAEGEWIVPEGHYFMMGDNRDRSNDSRFWGFVPDKYVVGKAVYIWMHWPSWTDIPNFRNNGPVE